MHSPDYYAGRACATVVVAARAVLEEWMRVARGDRTDVEVAAPGAIADKAAPGLRQLFADCHHDGARSDGRR